MPALATKQVSAPELKKSQDATKKPTHYPFWFGGSASCFAACFTHPLDLGKLETPIEYFPSKCANEWTSQGTFEKLRSRRRAAYKLRSGCRCKDTMEYG